MSKSAYLFIYLFYFHAVCFNQRNLLKKITLSPRISETKNEKYGPLRIQLFQIMKFVSFFFTLNFYVFNKKIQNRSKFKMILILKLQKKLKYF